MGDQPGSDKVFKEKCEPWNVGSFTCTLLTWIIKWYFHFIKINILHWKVSLASETVESIHFSVFQVKSKASQIIGSREEFWVDPAVCGDDTVCEGISHLAWQLEFNYLDPPGGRREISPISCPLTSRCIPMAFIFHPHNKWKVKKNKPKHGMVSLLKCLKKDTSISPLKLSMWAIPVLSLFLWCGLQLHFSHPFAFANTTKMSKHNKIAHPHSHSHIDVRLLIHIRTYRHT